MRLDLFVVFPNGFEHIDGILEIIHKYNDLEIIYFTKYEPYDFIQFIEDIYSVDTVPWQHIKAKTKYLENIGKDCYLILVKNHKPEEMLVGEGEYSHTQCMLINRVKWEIREKFNPIINRQRSENHIIHATDYEKQTIDLWSKLAVQHTLQDITSKPNKIIDAPFFIGKFDNFEIKQVDISDLLCYEMTNEKNKRVPIKESIYYKYVTGNKEPYIKYWNKFKGTRLLVDASPHKFDDLIDKYQPSEDFILIQDGKILDGNHRASILLSRGININNVVEVYD